VQTTSHTDAPLPSPSPCPTPAPHRACPERLQERSLAGRLFQTIPKVLSVGLLVAALFHILELGSLLVDRGVEVSGLGRGQKRLFPAYQAEEAAAAFCRCLPQRQCRCNCCGTTLGFSCLA
jgi:hypothetical protein